MQGGGRLSAFGIRPVPREIRDESPGVPRHCRVLPATFGDRGSCRPPDGPVAPVRRRPVSPARGEGEGSGGPRPLRLHRRRRVPSRHRLPRCAFGRCLGTAIASSPGRSRGRSDGRAERSPWGGASRTLLPAPWAAGGEEDGSPQALGTNKDLRLAAPPRVDTTGPSGTERTSLLRLVACPASAYTVPDPFAAPRVSPYGAHGAGAWARTRATRG
jgi:hypothetical protein